MSAPKLARAWSMPNKYTFKIAPIDELLNRYVLSQGAGWIDPFCGHSLRAQYRNDIDPKNSFALERKCALEFLKGLTGQFEGCLFDPPYSPRQMSEAYKLIGRKAAEQDTQNARFYSKCRDMIEPLIKPGGIVISFGWNSTGMGKNRGFQKVEVLLVNHGAAINDTIVVVEKKL